MYFNLLRLRIRQLQRQFERPGIFYIALLIIAFTGLIGFVSLQYRQPSHAWIMVGILSSSLLSVHVSRKDKAFVLSQLPNARVMMFVEYSVLSLPLTLPALFSSQWYLWPLMIISFYAIAHVNTTLRHRTLFPNLARIIPAQNFELLSLFRKNYLVFIVLYGAALATSFIIIAPVFILWLITLLLLSAYTECESLSVLTVEDVDAATFLKQKIKRHTLLLYAASLPTIVIGFIVHLDYYWLYLFLIIVQPVLITLGIGFKYAHYEPNRQLETGNILLSIIAGGSLVPFLLPLPLLFAIRYYRAAKQNLNNYLP